MRPHTEWLSELLALSNLTAIQPRLCVCVPLKLGKIFSIKKRENEGRVVIFFHLKVMYMSYLV